MAQEGQALSIAISGLRGTGRTQLYQQLELVLPKDKNLRGCEFAFLGNPFGHLPHPILYGDHKRHGVSRLYECWGWLNDFTQEKWVPALKAGKIPVMDGCGLDAVLYATASVGCYTDDKKVLDYHHHWVKDRIVMEGAGPPHYVMPGTDPDVVVNYLVEVKSDLSPEDARTFVTKETRVINEYFREGGGQHPPHILEPSLSPEKRVEQTVAYIRHLVR